MRLKSTFLILAIALLVSGGVIAEERDYTGVAPHNIRIQAFAHVKPALQVKATTASTDPLFAQSQKAVKANDWLQARFEILTVKPGGESTVLYPKGKVVSYSAKGATVAVGYISQEAYPRKIALYDYETGKLKSVQYSLSPVDVYAFDATGKLIEGNLETAFWEKPTYEKKVSAVGNKLLLANHIKERIAFGIEQDRQNANAGANERDNRVVVTKGILAFIESEDELAAVLAHEISHVLLRHRDIYPKPTQDEMLQQWLKLPVEKRQDSTEFSQSQSKELDADRKGLRLLIKAGYQPEAMISIVQKIGSDGSEQDLSTHPSGTRRIKALESQIKELRRTGILPPKS